MAVIERFAVNGFVDGLGGKVFGATFTKKDGTVRVMSCRRGTSTGIKGTGFNHAEASGHYLTVFDMNKKSYRNINIHTLTEIRVGQVNYAVR